jgi:hypothetical protein
VWGHAHLQRCFGFFDSARNVRIGTRQQFTHLVLLLSSITERFWPSYSAFYETHAQCSFCWPCLRAVLHWILRFCQKCENWHQAAKHTPGVVTEQYHSNILAFILCISRDACSMFCVGACPPAMLHLFLRFCQICENLHQAAIHKPGVVTEQYHSTFLAFI